MVTACKQNLERSPLLVERARPTTGITAAMGFVASAVHAGIRKKKLDLAVIAGSDACSAAAVFTTNKVQAAPVLLSKKHLASSGGVMRAIVVNSGNANACTGPKGDEDALTMARETAHVLGCAPEEVLVASTGVIGQPLPIELIEAVMPALGEGFATGGRGPAEAILTTDTFAKESVRRVQAAAGEYVVGGMAKGSGMIHPNMATTLGFVTTDAQVEPALLQAVLARAVEQSFNRISVDGDTSTNDMVAVLASGRSGVDVGAGGPRSLRRFEDALTGVLTDLAKLVAKDGEGASRLITVEVTSAASDEDALAAARTIAGSPLVKTAVHGADANWGRIVAAVGRSGCELTPERMSVALNGLCVLSPGYQSGFDEAEAKARLSEREVTIHVDLGLAHGTATVWTCDLTADYVAINASYRS